MARNARAPPIPQQETRARGLGGIPGRRRPVAGVSAPRASGRLRTRKTGSEKKTNVTREPQTHRATHPRLGGRVRARGVTIATVTPAGALVRLRWTGRPPPPLQHGTRIERRLSAVVALNHRDGRRLRPRRGRASTRVNARRRLRRFAEADAHRDACLMLGTRVKLC